MAFYAPFNIWGSVGIFTAIWVISSSLFSLKNKLILLKSKNYIIFLLNHNSILAHLGVGILILGITASSVFQKEYQKFINVNEQINIGDYQISFDKIETLEKNNFQSLKGSFSILEKNKKIAIVEPEKRFYYVSKMITTEAAIYHTILKDFYLVLGEKTNNGWSIIVYENPLVLLIWIGAFIMMISGLSTVWRK